MLKSFFKKFAGFQAPSHVFSYEICEIFKNTSFEEHLQTTASVIGGVIMLHMAQTCIIKIPIAITSIRPPQKLKSVFKISFEQTGVSFLFVHITGHHC